MADISNVLVNSGFEYFWRRWVPLNNFEGTNVALWNLALDSVDGANSFVFKANENGFEHLPIFVLGWQLDGASTGQLDHRANYFITGPFSGCTFAVDKNWYKPTVTHANLNNPGGAHGAPVGMDIGGMAAQINGNMAHCTSLLGKATSLVTGQPAAPNLTLIQPVHHPAPNNDAKIWVVGYRGYKGWYFYQQNSQTQDGMNFNNITLTRLN